jgi:hypothetical protein
MKSHLLGAFLSAPQTVSILSLQLTRRLLKNQAAQYSRKLSLLPNKKGASV